MSQRQRKEFHPEFFKNTLKIHIGESNFTRKDVVEGLKLVADLKNIDNICQYKSRKIWYIAFVDSFKSSELINKEIVIKKNKFTFEPAIKQSIFKCFKISWLPPKFNKIDYIAGCLCAGGGEVRKISQLKDSDGLNLNIYNISIEYPMSSSVNFLSITGKKEVFGETIFITCYGDPIRCVYCEEFGHKKLDCKKFKQICNQCGKRGHTVCTMAHKIAVEEEDNEIDVDDDEAKIEENSEKESGTSQAITPITLTQQKVSSETTNLKEATSNSNHNSSKTESENRNINKNLKIKKNSNDKTTKGKRKVSETTGSAEKQLDKKINSIDNENKSENSLLNQYDLDFELTDEDVGKIALELSKQLD